MEFEIISQRIERRYNQRGTKQDRIKSIKKFNGNKYNKSKHITRHFDDFNEESSIDFDDINDELYTNEIYQTESLLNDDNFADDDSFADLYLSNIIPTGFYFKEYFKLSQRPFYFHNYFCENSIKLNEAFVSRIKIILNKWTYDISNKFKSFASYIYHKYKKDEDRFFSLSSVFTKHLSLYFYEKCIEISDDDIKYIMDALFFIAKSDEKYNYIFTNYRNVSLLIFNEMLCYHSYIKRKKQYLLFIKGAQQEKVSWIPIEIQEYIMSFIP